MESNKWSCRYHLRMNPFSSFGCLLVVLLLSCHGSVAYKNYTVGDSLGWFDNLMQPKVDYQRWAAAKNFSLGDFLIFNTDKNHTVVQTYNRTTYEQCDYEDAEADDTTEWSAAAPQFSADPVTVAVPLLKVGPTFFFSGNYDGEQCQHGQRFGVTVARGQGLPDSLKPPSDAAPGPANPDAGDDTASSVPANFDHPKDVGDADSDPKPTSRAPGSGRRWWRTLLINVGLALGLPLVLSFAA